MDVYKGSLNAYEINHMRSFQILSYTEGVE